MAKSTMIKIKLLSSADTGYFYVTKKNSRTQTEKMVKKKDDPVAKKHVEFRETKIKLSVCRPIESRLPASVGVIASPFKSKLSSARWARSNAPRSTLGKAAFRPGARNGLFRELRMVA